MSEVLVGTDAFEDFVERARQFHGYPAPGLLLGGFMVEAAKARLPEGILFDAISETAWCLPDAVQMLTPCTVGNGWLKILNLGIYAVTLYDKETCRGFRVAVDTRELARWPEMQTWLLKSKPKREQDSVRLREEIRLAGASVCRMDEVDVQPLRVTRRSKGGIAVCPVCAEAYPANHGRVCRLCQGEAPYEHWGESPAADDQDGPGLRAVPAALAVGRSLAHDMTRIEPGKHKGPAFRRGQTLEAGDVCRLQKMGRNTVYVQPEGDGPAGWIHEDQAAKAFASALTGRGVEAAGEPREGKVQLLAAHDGVLDIDEDTLESFNMLPGVMAATRHHGAMVEAGARVAATRAIPLYLPEKTFGRAMRVLDGPPAINVLPMRKAEVGILVTGTEVFTGLVKDRFEPIISGKVKALGCSVAASTIVPDEREAVRDGVLGLLEAGADLIVTTAGLSVDPEDLTRQGLVDAGAEDMRYGAPMLPGAMLLLARIGTAQVVGVPACALFYKTTSFDVILPRLLAGMTIGRKELARLAVGGMCMECKTCTYPKCPFGK